MITSPNCTNAKEASVVIFDPDILSRVALNGYANNPFTLASIIRKLRKTWRFLSLKTLYWNPKDQKSCVVRTSVIPARTSPAAKGMADMGEIDAGVAFKVAMSAVDGGYVVISSDMVGRQIGWQENTKFSLLVCLVVCWGRWLQHNAGLGWLVPCVSSHRLKHLLGNIIEFHR